MAIKRSRYNHAGLRPTVTPERMARPSGALHHVAGIKKKDMAEKLTTGMLVCLLPLLVEGCGDKDLRQTAQRSSQLQVMSCEPKSDIEARPAIADSELAKKVRRIVVEQLGVEMECVRDNANFVDDLGADSLDMVELEMAFEENFDIEITDEDAESITTVGDAIRYLQEH